MRKQSGSIDGFVPRRSERQLGIPSEERTIKTDPSGVEARANRPRPILSTNIQPISRKEIDDSLKGIDDDPSLTPRRRGLFGRRKVAKPAGRRKKLIKRIILAIVFIVIIIAGYVGIHAFLAGTSIFKGNIFDLFQNKPLKQDAHGRTNILVYGTSGSYADMSKPGYEQHPGAQLTDTIMLLSINQHTKDAYLISLPRDLYVDYGGACSAGYQGKINNVYDCFSNGGQNDAAGAKQLSSIVSNVTGLSIQYYAHINWEVVVDTVNAVGGVDVNVQGDGGCLVPGYPNGSVVDANMKIAYTPGTHHMNGLQALKFSRARGEIAPNCGLARGDFDRQANQQKVLRAIQTKAVSGGTLTNITKVTSLFDAMGKNLRTNFETSEIQTLVGLAKDIPTNKIQSLPLVGDNLNLIDGQMIDGISFQVSASGMLDYTVIRDYIAKKLYANAVSKEGAHLALFNGSGIEGYAKTQTDALEKRGFTITATDNAPSQSDKAVTIYDRAGTKYPKTKAELESFYHVNVINGNGPINVSSDTDFVIIYGVQSSAK